MIVNQKMDKGETFEGASKGMCTWRRACFPKFNVDEND